MSLNNGLHDRQPEAEAGRPSAGPFLRAATEGLQHVLHHGTGNARSVVVDRDLDAASRDREADGCRGPHVDRILDEVADGAAQLVLMAVDHDVIGPAIDGPASEVGELVADRAQQAREVEPSGSAHHDAVANERQGAVYQSIHSA